MINMVSFNETKKNRERITYVITAPHSIDNNFYVFERQDDVKRVSRYLAYHWGGADLNHSLAPIEAPELKFREALFNFPSKIACILIEEIDERHGQLVITGGGPLVAVVTDINSGFAPAEIPPEEEKYFIADISEVSTIYWNRGVGDLFKLHPLIGYHTTIAESLLGKNIQEIRAKMSPHRPHTILDHLGLENPYGGVIYFKDQIGRMRVKMAPLREIIYTKGFVKKWSSVFRIIRPLTVDWNEAKRIISSAKVRRS